MKTHDFVATKHLQNLSSAAECDPPKNFVVPNKKMPPQMVRGIGNTPGASFLEKTHGSLMDALGYFLDKDCPG